MPELKFYLLGTPRVELDDRPTEISRRKAIALLAYLAVTGQVHTREGLAALLWPDYEPSQSFAYLRRTLWALNNSLGKSWLDAGREQIGLINQESFWLDVIEFEAGLSANRQKVNLADMGAAVSLYQGEFMAGFTLRDAPEFDTWQRFTAERLRHQFGVALEQLVLGYEAQGDLEPALEHARRWLSVDSLHEPAHRALMRLYAASGRRTAALRQYESCVAILNDELGLPPQDETIALHRQIAQGRWSPKGKCPNCDAPVEPAARFCARCGYSLGQPSAEQQVGRQKQPNQAERSPSSTIPSQLVKRILRESQTISGERRTVTVLFADAVDSTALGQRLDPEDLYNLIQEALRHMMEAVYMFDGHVAHFRGDGIMAIFGAPIAHEDSARRAVSAALEMQRSLAGFAQGNEERLGVELRFRIGLNTGPVVVGQIGNDLAMEFTALGDTVNLAARLQAAAEPGAVYVAEDTFRATQAFFDFEAVGPLSLKGKKESVPAFKVIGEWLARTRLEAAVERGLTPYVGRQHELDLLTRDLESVKDGRGQVVLVSGEAGIGKSRLLLEFRRLVQDEVTWLEGQCIPYGQHIPYRPVADLVKRAFQVEESDSDARIIQRVDERIARWAQTMLVTVPYLKWLLNVDPGDPTILKMDPRDRRAGIFDGLRALVLQESADRPLVLVVEDLHWIDEQSEAALQALVDVIATEKLLLILTFRPGHAHSLGERSYFTHVALGELPPEQRLLLAGNVLGQATLPRELVTFISAKAEGNPFYIEEVTRSLVEAGAFQGQNDDHDLVQAVGQLHIPDTIQEVILSRIDRLDAEARATLQVASVIGREFNARLLAHISDSETALDQILTGLKSLELIYQESYFPEQTCIFKHALTRDVVYQTLLRERRKALHRRIGLAIEELYADRLSEQVEMLAHHYSEGEQWDEALIYLVKAGDKAAAAYANQDALDYYARALVICELLGPSTLKTAAHVARRRGNVNLSIADFEAAVADYSRLRDVAQALGDDRLEGTALFLRSVVEFEDHDLVAAERSLKAVLTIAGEEFEDIRFTANSLLAITYKVQNHHAEALAPYEEAKRLAAVVTDPAKHIWWRVVESISLNWAGRFDEALAAHQRYEKDDDYWNDLHISWNKSLVLGGKGQYQQAIDLLSSTLAACERIGENYIRVRVLNTLGWIYGELHDHQRALTWNRTGIKDAQDVGFPDAEVESNARLNLADNLIALGRLDEAEEHLLFVENIIRHPRPQDHFSLWRYSQRHFHSYGELWMARGELDKALAYADECLALAEESGSRKNIVKGRRLRSQVFLAGGQLPEAGRELVLGLEIARQVGNPNQLWKTLVAIGELRTAEGRSDDARNAYQDALAVIHQVTGKLRDQALRDTLLESDAVQAIIAKAGDT